MDITEAQTIIANAQITAPAVNMLDVFENVKGMTMASVCYVSKVTLAAKSPLRYKIVKVTKASVSLANNLREYTNVFINKVKRTATEEVEDWQAGETWYQHTDTFCVAQHKTKANQFYLYSLYNSAESMYINLDTGLEISKADVAAEMSPAAGEKLLGDNSEVYNKTNDVTHKAIVRVVGTDNLASLTVQGTTYTGQFTYSE